MIRVAQHPIIHNRGKYKVKGQSCQPPCFEWDHTSVRYETKLDFLIESLPESAFEHGLPVPGLCLKQLLTLEFDIQGRAKNCGKHVVVVNEVFPLRGTVPETVEDLHCWGFPFNKECSEGTAKSDPTCCRFLANVRSETSIVLARHGNGERITGRDVTGKNSAVIKSGSETDYNASGATIATKRIPGVGGRDDNLEDGKTYIHRYMATIDHCRDWEILSRVHVPYEDRYCGFQCDENGKPVLKPWAQDGASGGARAVRRAAVAHTAFQRAVGVREWSAAAVLTMEDVSRRSASTLWQRAVNERGNPDSGVAPDDGAREHRLDSTSTELSGGFGGGFAT